MFFRMFFVLNRVSVSNSQRLTDHPDHLYLNIGQLLPSPVSSERVCKSASLQVCRSAGLRSAVCSLRSASLQSAFVAHRSLCHQNESGWRTRYDLLCALDLSIEVSSTTGSTELCFNFGHVQYQHVPAKTTNELKTFAWAFGFASTQYFSSDNKLI